MLNILEVDPRILTAKPNDLVEEPVVVYVNDFNEEATGKFIKDMNRAQSTRQPVIPIVIDSYGGQVYSLMCMIGVIEHSTIPVATIALGKAMSCGAILLSCGQEGMRYADPNATIMIHEVSSMEWGKVEEVKAGAKETDRLNKLVFEKMAKNCRQSDPKHFLDIIHEKKHAEWFLNPKEAKKHNLINQIKVPVIRTVVSVTTTFDL